MDSGAAWRHCRGFLAVGGPSRHSFASDNSALAVAMLLSGRALAQSSAFFSHLAKRGSRQRRHASLLDFASQGALIAAHKPFV